MTWIQTGCVQTHNDRVVWDPPSESGGFDLHPLVNTASQAAQQPPPGTWPGRRPWRL